MGWPAGLIGYKLLTDCGSLIGGVFALIGGRIGKLLPRGSQKQDKGSAGADRRYAAAGNSAYRTEGFNRVLLLFDAPLFTVTTWVPVAPAKAGSRQRLRLWSPGFPLS